MIQELAYDYIKIRKANPVDKAERAFLEEVAEAGIHNLRLLATGRQPTNTKCSLDTIRKNAVKEILWATSRDGDSFNSLYMTCVALDIETLYPSIMRKLEPLIAQIKELYL